jgi:hypothetical protein
LWMGSIYRRAKEVAAWTGEEENGSDLAMAFIDQLNRLKRGSQTLGHNNDNIGEKRFMEFLARPYWRRVWIIQELALGRSVTIHCGQLQITWNALSSSIRKPYLDKYAASPDLINIRNLVQFQYDASWNKPVPFLEALRRSSTSLSTEPRDKVFALLSLVYDSALYIPVPNYKQSLRDISVSMTLSAWSTTSSLDIIPLLAPHCDRSDIPTWSPNWFALENASLSTAIDYLMARSPFYLMDLAHPRIPEENSQYPRYQTTLGTEIEFFVSGNTLRLRGLWLGDIQAVLRFKSGEYEHVASVSRLAGVSFEKASAPNPYGTERGLLNAISLSLSSTQRDNAILESVHQRHYMFPWIFDEDFEKCFARDFDTDLRFDIRKVCRPKLKVWIDAAKGFPIQGRSMSEWSARYNRPGRFRNWSDNEVHRLCIHLDQILQRRNFMTTDIGYVGWAHDQAEHGDSIYLLPGCSIPVILRARDRGGFTVVGDAWVQGVMEGERVKPEFFWREKDDEALTGSQENDWTDIEIY